ncbi:MAG: hypothetical protein IJ567_00800 [Lachnospiraceae bacterium]|nr:hypothetical protein [Lachnospiraceae bacterium]
MYQEKHHVYESNKSTAYSFLPTGLIGLILIVLVAADIIPLPVKEPLKTELCIVLALLFLIFLVIGFLHLRKLKTLAAEADTAKRLTEEIQTWFVQTYPAKVIDAAVFNANEKNPEEAEEQLYFQRYEYMKAQLQTDYPDLDEEYTDYLLELLYNQLF